ncbi:MAG: hypothetical protein AB4368_26560 [Xenococcaceae cyanobacterium]
MKKTGDRFRREEEFLRVRSAFSEWGRNKAIALLLTQAIAL